jgi:diguanylate cyclase (GGDEF)-like protein
MKRCSSCDKEYADNELRYCTECGTPLADVPTKVNAQASTVLMPNEYTTKQIAKSEPINRVPFPNAQVYDKTLTKPRKREIEELILSSGLKLKAFHWEEAISSVFQRPDVRVSKLVVESTEFYFLFNSARDGSMSFTRCPGVNSKLEEGRTGDWPYQVAAAREWLAAVKAEIQERQELRLEIEDSMSGTELDALLGVYQRSAFDRDLHEFTTQSAATGNPLALVLSDADKFKHVNDTYGHPTGDEVLQAIANTIKRITAGKGKTYRYGGEELAVLLPNFSADEAAALAERIRKTIETESIGAKAIKITASFGVADLPTHATTSKDLLEAADTALYRAKNLGRNLVRISGEPEPEQRPRSVSRRLPDGSRLSDAELETILTQWFRSYNAFCPKDGTSLDVQEIQSDETVTVDLIISCRRCGLMERIDADPGRP